jgi:hypothetical protein
MTVSKSTHFAEFMFADPSLFELLFVEFIFTHRLSYTYLWKLVFEEHIAYVFQASV